MNTTCDARTLKCPLPLLRTKKALKALNSGNILEVLTTDPQAPKDLEAFCKVTGHTLLKTESMEDHHVTWIKKRHI